MNQQELTQALMAAFLEELPEHIAALNSNLLAIEKSPEPAQRHEHLRNLFRAAHTIKGSAQTTNIDVVQRAAHLLEDILSAIRDSRRDFTPELFAILYQTADAFEEAGMRLREQRDLSDSPLAQLLPRIDLAARGETSKPAPIPNRDEPRRRSRETSDRTLTNPATSESRSAPAVESVIAALVAPTSPVSAIAKTSDAGNIRHEPELVPAASVRVAAEKLDTLLAQCGELLVARRRVESQFNDVTELREMASDWSASWRTVEKPLRQLLRQRDRTVQRSSDSNGTRHHDRSDIVTALPRQALSVLQQTGDRIRQFEKSLDQLATRVRSDGRQLGHSCDTLEDEVYRVRMLPFAEACAGLDRAVRDVAHASGKQVELIIHGAEVEVDRSVLEGLKAPLLHLVRNSVDHGVELPADRCVSGKPETATITVAAALRGAMIEVTVSDDGRGIELDRVRETATKRGWHVPTDDRELTRLLFQPGFSTARTVTDVSGRGVGLDVVQSKIEGLHGNVDVSFAAGFGTRFTLNVPLTLTTIRAVLLRIGNDIFAVPTTAVQQIVRFTPQDLAIISGRRCLLTPTSPIPSSNLGELLGRPPMVEHSKPSNGDKHPAKSLGVVLTAGSQQVLFAIDEVLAEQDIVVKSLGTRVRRLHRVSAATLLPSGQIALLLNVAHLLRMALGQQVRRESADDIAKPTTRRKRLLVADDSLTTRMLLKTILEAADYEIVTAVDGEQAFQLLPQQPIDLVVSDVDMPRMDGFALTASIRAAKPFAQLPVVLVTARETDADKARGLEVGANAYVTKGAFDQRTLLEVISRLV